MNIIRENKQISIIILISLFIFLAISITFGRYIYNAVHDFILETKGFYFNSSVLKKNNKTYNINNWDGVNSYEFTIDLNNKKTNDIYTTADISYEAYVSCENTVTCKLSKQTGIIYENAHTDSYIITVTPKKAFQAGETVRINTSVISKSPYTKTISATYILGVQKPKFSYYIEDSTNAKFLTLNLTNSIGYYKVQTPFLNYNVGDEISIDTYNNLTLENKKKCFSAIVTLTFDPRKVLLDMTNDTYLDKLPTNYQETYINGYRYVKKYSFKIDASSNTKIIFYKETLSNNYTYPIVNNSSIINVDVVTVS